MIKARESRPDTMSGAAITSVVATRDQDTGATPVTHLTRADLEASRPLYVLVMLTQRGTIRRRVFLSLHSAVRATERAQARGHDASLELCRVVPVGHTLGGDAL